MCRSCDLKILKIKPSAGTSRAAQRTLALLVLDIWCMAGVWLHGGGVAAWSVCGYMEGVWLHVVVGHGGCEVWCPASYCLLMCCIN